MASNSICVEEFINALGPNLLQKWYPLVIDREYGGYFTNVTHDWKLAPGQEKMIVTQARHVWTTSKAAELYGPEFNYEETALYGHKFLRELMWDEEYGGFYQIRNRQGGFSEVRGWRDEKRTYGNAFGVYALAALFGLTHEEKILQFARKAFAWIEEHAYDPRFKGYFQFLTREGKVFDTTSAYKTIASDGNEAGFKDQNASIHLLEAYTELYKVWKDPFLREQLLSILILIRDTMVDQQGYLRLFFHNDWTPVSFRDASAEERERNYGLDHVSFGHDYETAFLMLEASHALGLDHDTRTLRVARTMLDHALANGWDEKLGGFYDGGYYFRDQARCTIIRHTKNWWAQAEALNVLLLFSRIFPGDERYPQYAIRQWDYVNTYILDHERGDWFEGGIDKEPHFTNGPKSHMWKCSYHTSRALMNCIALVSDRSTNGLGHGWDAKRRIMDDFVAHWSHVTGAPAV
jgi:mannobiose 2-epimerase